MYVLASVSASAHASVSLAPVLGRTSAGNQVHDMTDDASVNLASVSLASLRQRVASALFHLSTASPHSLGSINNNMSMIPSCTWKFHPTHPIQDSLISNRHSYHFHLHNGPALNTEKSETILLGTHARNRTIVGY